MSDMRRHTWGDRPDAQLDLELNDKPTLGSTLRAEKDLAESVTHRRNVYVNGFYTSAAGIVNMLHSMRCKHMPAGDYDYDDQDIDDDGF